MRSGNYLIRNDRTVIGVYIRVYQYNRGENLMIFKIIKFLIIFY